MIDPKVLKTEKSLLKIHAKALGIPSGAAEVFIKNAFSAAEKSLKGRKIITSADFKRATAKELKKYHPDLAYVYENYAKII